MAVFSLLPNLAPALANMENAEELKRKIPVGNVLFFAENFKWDTFATDVVGTFEIYLPRRKRNKYNGNWFDFPMTELRELKYALSL